MSDSSARAVGVDALTDRSEWVSPARLLALSGVALALGAFCAVLHDILVVTGEPSQLYPVAVGAALAGMVLAALIGPRTAGLLAAAALALGTYVYVSSLPGGAEFLVVVAPMVDDAFALLSGLSVLRIVNADVWALVAAPGPVFLAWYLAVRRRYVPAAAVAGGALGVVVLSGDATVATTLAGVLGVTLAVAFGDCDRRGETIRNADGVAVVLASMVVLTLVVGVVPGAAGSLFSTEGFGDGPDSVESSLVHAGDSAAVTGSVELSPEVRFTVEADSPAYWRVGTYDRYTGGGWVRTGASRTYEGSLRDPPGETRTLEQRFTAESDVATMPAANAPTRIEESPVPVEVTDSGTFQPASPLRDGESYTVQSEVPAASPGELREADTDYPDAIAERYTQLPESVPDRVERRTSQLTAEAENPYDTARVLEQWLANSRGYSLDVERPRGDVADAFLFEMDAGYCTYFATTMVTMLRSQDVPARFAVGYTPGQRVDENEWVVRGYDSHAWVEVYFPEHGWMRFDPTPSEPRDSTERQRLSEARGNLDDPTGGDVDTNESRNSDLDRGTPEPTPTPGEETATPTPEASPGAGGPNDGGDGESDWPDLPSPTPQQVGVGLLVALGAFAAGWRVDAGSRLYRQVWLRRRPRGDPESVVAGAYQRVVALQDRTKRPGETPRQFLARGDERARRVAELYERARYGGEVDEAAADEATRLFSDLLTERSRLPYPRETSGAESR